MVKSQIGQFLVFFLGFVALTLLAGDRRWGDIPAGSGFVAGGEMLADAGKWDSLRGRWRGECRIGRLLGYKMRSIVDIRPINDKEVSVAIVKEGASLVQVAGKITAAKSTKITWTEGGRDQFLEVEQVGRRMSTLVELNGRPTVMTFFREGANGHAILSVGERLTLPLKELGILVLGGVAAIGIPYSLVAGGLFLLFWVLKKDRWRHRRIQPLTAKRPDVKTEVKLSVVGFFSGALTSLLTVMFVSTGHARLYTDISKYGWGYYALSLVIVYIMIDAYLYWSHRLLHVHWIYTRFHYQHHRSRQPSPWAALATSFGEAALNAPFFPLFIAIFPTHISVFPILGLGSILRNVANHIGFEIFPPWLVKSPLRWNLTVTFHELHHRYYNFNYGCYFTFWDKLMKTEHPKTVSTFLEVTARREGEVAALTSASEPVAVPLVR